MTGQILAGARVATLDSVQSYGLIDRGAVVVSGGRVDWVGPECELPGRVSGWPRRNLGGRLVTPGLIDCHTHLVYGGSRAREFEMRLTGASYEEISRSGGGIMSTVQATRGLSLEDLVASALPRLDALIAEGVTTLEIKSGYGMDLDTELQMLKAARQLGERRTVRVVTSFLGAHAIPDEFRDRSDAYIDTICLPALEAAHEAGLADAVDGFCEGIAFSPSQIDRVFARARQLGLPVKLHADQLSDLGGAALASRHAALSADHLEYVSESGVKAMAKAGTVAVLLPGAYYTLREPVAPPVSAFRDHGVPMAVATDANPGSSPIHSILTILNMACTLFRLTPEEALAGVTCHAAAALGFRDRGRIRAGCLADLAVWDLDHPRELACRIGPNPLVERISGIGS
ncbi:MAG: imidazolonepropionase [Paracoccaceae bacterium]|nr:imidazolonepropionase [Paracoccaceae bacterium]